MNPYESSICMNKICFNDVTFHHIRGKKGILCSAHMTPVGNNKILNIYLIT